MEEKILDIMKNVFGVEDIDTTCSQENCQAWDSLAQLNLVVELESEFDVTLEPEEIGEMKSFADVLKLISDKVKE